MPDLEDIKVVDFVTHPIKNFETESYQPYDITAEELPIPADFLRGGQFSDRYYCWALLLKMTTLQRDQIKPFLIYQNEEMEYPFAWLRKTQTLLRRNFHWFEQRQIQDKFCYLTEAVKNHYHEYDDAIKADIDRRIYQYKSHRFDMNHVALDLAEYESYHEKVAYLLRTKYEYLQGRPSFLVPQGVPFDQMIDLELDKLEQEQKLKEKMYNNVYTGQPKEKIQTNLSVARLAALSYLLHAAKLLVIPNKNAFARTMADNFTCRRGKDFSWKNFKNLMDRPDESAIAFWLEHLLELFKLAKGLNGAEA